MTALAHIHRLHYGRCRQPLVEVVRDEWPCMYRVRWSDGTVSDMTNLSRAVDAAAAICERGPPARNRRLFGWETEPSKTTAKASPMRPNGKAAQSRTNGAAA